MTNVEAAIKALTNAGYKAKHIAGHTIVIDDVVHCRSGSKYWIETKQVRVNVSMNLSQVIRFIGDRN